jgi:hypothetical protein
MLPLLRHGSEGTGGGLLVGGEFGGSGAVEGVAVRTLLGQVPQVSVMVAPTRDQIFVAISRASRVSLGMAGC